MGNSSPGPDPTDARDFHLNNQLCGNYIDIVKIEQGGGLLHHRKASKQSGRPGRKAKRADSELSDNELQKRELRRERNKEAARRCRQRRLDKTRGLEDQVSDLQMENGHLEYDNERLKKQIENLQFQLETFCSQSLDMHSGEIPRRKEMYPNSTPGPTIPANNMSLMTPTSSQGHFYNRNIQQMFNSQPPQTRIVSKTASGARKEVSIEKKEQTIFMNL
jgi:hypothetical protein